NTSFNVRGEPIVCTPQDAFACFLRTDLDRLALGSFLLDHRAKRAVDLGIRQTLEQDWGTLGLEAQRGPHALDDSAHPTPAPPLRQPSCRPRPERPLRPPP